MDTLVREAMRLVRGAEGWLLIPGFRLQRLQLTVEAVLVAPGAVLAFARDEAAASAAAVDLADFHAGCEGVPVLPVALLRGVAVTAQRPLPLPGALPAVACTRLQLPGLLQWVAALPPAPGFDANGWAHAAYRPVPALMTAATQLYARHDEARLLLANTGRGDLQRTLGAVRAAVQAAMAEGRRLAVFVTGAPGAGKTLCGLDLAFEPGAGAAFLTGNPALLHVLRAALVRDAARRGLAARAARQRVEAVVQPLHAFRDHYAANPEAPPDRLLVIDEAQRCWTGDYARRKTQNHAVRLRFSEPGHVLDAMGRHDGGCVVVCLLGGGQEIHAGEGGVAAWGAALAERPGWSAAASPATLEARDPRQRLPEGLAVTTDPALHLGEAVRAFRAPRLAAWVDAVLANDAAGARRIADGGLPVRLTRSLGAAREALRRQGGERCGLLASSGARRLRAEGLGAFLPHQDEDAVARWFLDAWPDVRASGALEVAATEFAAQGLELDHAGLCWDLDFVRTEDGADWRARAFRATRWTAPRTAEAASNKRNAYRVLMTRARRSLVIWVPRGDARDATRKPEDYDVVSAFLQRCGAATLDECATIAQDAAPLQPELP